MNENARLDLEPLKENYFSPEDVIVSKNPFTQWSLRPDDSYYKTIWNDIRNYYLPVIFSGKPSKVLSKGDWQSLLSEVCTRVDFRVDYPKSMLKWFTGISADRQGFNGIKSIAILPQKDVNETVNTVYVYDESAVYMYLVEIKEKMQPKIYYESLPQSLTEAEYMPMTAIGKAFPEIKTEPENADLPIYSYPNTFQSFQTINIKIPDVLVLDPLSDDLHRIQESILLNQKDSLAAYHDRKNANAVFSDLDNVYTLDSHGILKYRYVPQTKSESGDVKSAFSNAVSFLELRKGLVGDADIVLTRIEKSKRNDGSYLFTFDYMFEGDSIFITDIKNNGYGPVPAITITANDKRVLECSWIIREITGNKDPKNYLISLVELTDRISANNPELLNNLLSIVTLEDVKTGYYFDTQADSQNQFSPTWLIKIKSSGKEEYYQTLLPEEGGD